MGNSSITENKIGKEDKEHILRVRLHRQGQICIKTRTRGRCKACGYVRKFQIKCAVSLYQSRGRVVEYKELERSSSCTAL